MIPDGVIRRFEGTPPASVRQPTASRGRIMQEFRKEHDSLGELSVPADAYYGCQTVRALENYCITGDTISKNVTLIKALAPGQESRGPRQQRAGSAP